MFEYGTLIPVSRPFVGFYTFFLFVLVKNIERLDA